TTPPAESFPRGQLCLISVNQRMKKSQLNFYIKNFHIFVHAEGFRSTARDKGETSQGVSSLSFKVLVHHNGYIIAGNYCVSSKILAPVKSSVYSPSAFRTKVSLIRLVLP